LSDSLLLLMLLCLVLLQAFYNGFLPNFARLGSWNVAMFLMLEQVGAAVGAVQRCRHCFQCLHHSKANGCEPSWF
jgi:hypothetical protein